VSVEEYDVIVIGAGLCGLSAAYHLESRGTETYTVIESLGDVGGLARTVTYEGGFSFDHSIHILYTGDPYAAALIEELLGSALTRQTRRSYCFTEGVFTEYPYQANTYGLPPEVVASNLEGLVEAHLAAATQGAAAPAPAHFEEWIYRTFGRGIAENFMLPYNRRVWACEPREMAYDWIAERVPMPSLREVLMGALQPPTEKFGPNREFWYPAQGGIEALPRGFAERIPLERFQLTTTVAAVDTSKREVVLTDGRRLGYQALVSTLPLPTLVGLSGKVPADVAEATSRLRHNTVYTVNVGLRGADVALETEMHWLYLPSDATVFHRLSFPHRFSPWMAPEDSSSVQVEVSVPSGTRLDEKKLVRDTLAGLVLLGILDSHEATPTDQGGRVELAEVMHLDPAYIIYDLQHSENTRLLRDYFRGLDIETRGRFGEWEYFNMDHAILSGRDAIESLLQSTSLERTA
jgi:protoporphyrinogen oxidase